VKSLADSEMVCDAVCKAIKKIAALLRAAVYRLRL